MSLNQLCFSLASYLVMFIECDSVKFDDQWDDKLIEKDANRRQGQENLNPLDMLRRGHLMKTLILLFNWVTVCVGAYTLMLNATKLYGDLFLNYTLVVLVGDLPGTIALLFTLKFFGRRFNLFYTQFILGNNQGIVIEFRNLCTIRKTSQ